MKMGAITVIKGWSANCMLCSMFILYIPVLLCSFHVYCADRVSLSSGYKRYVGIWYKWDKQTVVWVANRDDLLINTTAGAFRFAKDGNLQVMDTSTEKAHWNSECYNWGESCNTTDTIVNLTDSGNLVLYGYSSEYGNLTSLWESFENPANTFLPGMTLSLDGNINLTSWRGRDARCSRKSERNSRQQKGDDDLLEKLEYWVQNTNRTWYLSDAEPSNYNCSMHNACGNFGSCNLNNKLKCKCLPGFKPYVAQKWHSGDFSDGCTKNLMSCGNTFLSLKMMKIGKNLEQRSWVENETECKELCLKHCDCKSYSYNRGSEMPCWIWKQELVNLEEEYEGGYNISIRVAISDIAQIGDPMYFSFNCNTTSGQVSFKAPSGTYRVTSIDQNTTKFSIQVKEVGTLRLNQSLPFNQTTPRNSSSNVLSRVTDVVEIVWEPPLEPFCNLSTDCKDWPHSTCKSASDGKGRCLCTKSFRWDGTKLSCTQVSSPSEKGMILLPIVGITSVIVLCAITFIYIWRRKMTKRQENRQIDQRRRVQRMLYSESYVQDLIDSGEFQEEDEKGIDVPSYDLESIRVATNNFSDENKLGQGGYGPVYKVISATFSGMEMWTHNKLLDLMDETLRETCIADQFVKCLNIGLLCVQHDPSDRPTMSIIIKMLDGETVNLPTHKQPAFSIRRDQSSSTSSS
uniref:Non-specific serine/threonine protein kinase n=1 Tax=Quercus lobata TaxID=97700 RepID=A0A7N2MA81_QUELO